MAGPEQISDPRFRQYSEAGNIVDDSAAVLIEGLSQTGLKALEYQQTSALRDEVAAKRDAFLRTPMEEALDNTVASGQVDNENLALSGGAIIGDIDPDRVDVNVGEIVRMEQELAGKIRAQRQGITPTRALEVEVEKITRRYIDRFPGLATQFQQVAQTALGTSNNLLSATMRAQEELFAAAEAAAQDELEQVNALAEAAFDEGYVNAVFGATPELKATAITQYLAKKKWEGDAALMKAQEDAAAARGDVSRTQELFNGRLAITNKLAMRNVSSAVTRALPEAYRDRGVGGFRTYINDNRNDPEAMADLQRNLEAAQAQVRFAIGQDMRTSGAITDTQRNAIVELQDAIDAQFGVLIDAASNKRVSEEADYRLNVLENASEFEFETLFGRDRVFMEKLLQFVPVDSSLWNQWTRNVWERELAERMIKEYGKLDINTLGTNAGLGGQDVNLEDGPGQELVNTVHSSAIGSFREFLENPNEAMDKGYQPTHMLKGFDSNFKSMPPELKRSLLDMVGSPEWDTLANLGVNAETQKVIDSLAEKVTEWGSVKLENAVNDFMQDVGGPSVSNLYHITGKFDPQALRPLAAVPRAAQAAAARAATVDRPIAVADLVQVQLTSQGIVFRARPIDQLDSLGVDTNPTNLSNVSKLVARLNSVHGAGLNSWAYAMGNLGTGSSREELLQEVLAVLTPAEEEDAEVQ